MADVTLAAVGKTYPDGTVAVQGVDIEIADGELLVLVGPSGCGKTTVLRMVAGLETITTGTASIRGRVINDVNEADRDIAMVFQNYALYPHLTVAENIAFPLRLARVKKAERAKRVAEVAQTLGLSAHLGQKPGQLSGGQRQRVAMGRAIVREPQVFLMDEPLSNLDAKLRVQMRAQILEMQKRLGVTTLYVTHDQAEAMTLGDRVAVLRSGSVLQIGAPADVYRWPANVFVASFLGSPAMNLLTGRLERADDGLALSLGKQRLVLDAAEVAEYGHVATADGIDVVVGIRPEVLGPSHADDDRARALLGEVNLLESLGSDALVHVRLDGVAPVSATIRRLALEADDVAEAEEGLTREASIVVARFPASSTVARGDQIELGVDSGALVLFDATTGEALRAGEPRA
jgi:multiple sugar transport system ATP-binding protein